MTPPLTPIQYACAVLVGRPYVYGAGSPRDFVKGDFARLAECAVSPLAPRGAPRGLDCNGATQGILVTVGWMPSTEPDRSAHDMLWLCDPVDLSRLEEGDLLFYKADGAKRAHHVTMYYGRGQVFGMSGGTSHTFGGDPGACGRILPVTYSRPWIAGRLKAAVRASVR